MKKIHFIISLFVLAIFSGCTEDDAAIDLEAVNAPKNIDALVTITQDNSGNVTFLPRGEGVTEYEIYFADGSNESAFVAPGQTTTHQYDEGVYQVKIVATTLNGKKTEVTQELVVSFLQPINLVATIGKVATDNFSITVTAKADLEAFFQVYFGDAVDEVPVNFMEGEIITHKYAALGSYQIRIVALSGGAASKEYTDTVVITNPILLPITFETATPEFGNFGGANSVVVSNPDVSSGNGSTKVGKLTKNAGSEIWAGSLIQLASPIDFANKVFKMKVWSPKAGIVVKLKVENLTNQDINKEVDVTLNTANSWQELSFDFTGINTANTYQKVVVFFDFGNSGTGATYYFDDIKLVSGEPSVALPLDFEIPTIISGNFGGATTVTANNPHNDANNSSSKVGAATKSSGSEVWGGSFITLTDPINFSTQKKMKMKVWSPRAGMPVLLKVENLTTQSISKEVVVNTTVANAWETLTFDFTSLDLSGGKTYQKVVFIFDNATRGDGSTFYFDDIQQSN